MRLAVAALFLLAACSGGGHGNQSATPQDLESAAIERGLVRDPAETDLTGLYARDTDRVCVVRKGDSYRIGAFVDYGDGLSCTGTGTASVSPDRVTVPPECAKFCGPRASFAALDAERLSGSAAEARALRSAEGKRLCDD
jgi:hypothetical protein